MKLQDCALRYLLREVLTLLFLFPRSLTRELVVSRVENMLYKFPG